jgi:hypothetical protein
MLPGQARQLVADLYRDGAAVVFVDPTPAGKSDDGADCWETGVLVVRLPADPARRRAIYEWNAVRIGYLGFAGQHIPQDTGGDELRVEFL